MWTSMISKFFLFSIVLNLTRHITEELFTEVPLGLPFVSVKVVFGPPGLLVTGKQEKKNKQIFEALK